MFKKILIANRGEIACRVIKTCRKMGIPTVAVYSEADADALHVEMADEAVFLGPPPAAESYLLADKILAAARETGAEAIHPGFGFLSERAEFVEAVEAAGLVFIGPGTRAIAAMGDKIESKKLAADAKVNTVPGHIGIIDTPEEAVGIAKDIGYPVMIKASAGGGGKGMRIAASDDEVEEGFRAAKSEAKSSFADDRVFIEKFIEEPRHIEIQVLADAHGTTLYLGERECSIQRRHQKVIEEAPSPFIDAKTRKAMGEQAVALAKAVDYRSAGTVEFIVDKDKNFYFLEMNTRLQVEHPVTELITGIDLVEQMIRVAAGEKLGFAQKDVTLTGWAVESRVYAEDPYRGFLPSIGRLTRYRPPEETDTVRIDTGVHEGAEITMFYDPMIAKLVTYGPDRDAAIAAMQAALDSYYIRGIAHNIPFLAAVMRHPRFQAGELTTAFIAEEYPNGFSGAPLSDGLRDRLIAIAAFLNAVERSRETQISAKANPLPGQWVVSIDSVQETVVPELTADGVTVKFSDGRAVAIRSAWVPGKPLFRGEVDGVGLSVAVEHTGLGYRLATAGVAMEATVLAPRAAELYAHMPEKVEVDTSKYLLCPMPGLVVSVSVAEGDEVKTGQALAIVEAMKMENILRAEKDATVAKIRVAPGDSLAVDDVIMEFD